jgi:hypothetical protein
LCNHGNIVNIIKKIAIDMSGTNTKNLAIKFDCSEAIAGLVKNIEDFEFDLGNKITDALRWSFVFCVCSTAITMGVVWLMMKK